MCDALCVDKLSVEYATPVVPLRALSEVTFAVPPGPAGSSVCCLGASGAGKSTLGLAVIQLLPHEARVKGKVSLPGGLTLTASGGRLREYRRRSVGVVLQDAPGSLVPGVPIGRQARRVFAVRRGLARRDAERSAREGLARVGLEDVERVWRAMPSELSGGMCQRVMISLSVLAAPEPRLMICDEPTSALDSVSAAQVLELLFRIKAEHRITMLFITHDVRLVWRFDWVAILSEGRLAEFERSDQFLASPRSEEGRRLLDAGKALGSSSVDRVNAQQEIMR